MTIEDKASASWKAIVEASKRGTTKRPFRKALQLGTARVERMLLQHPLRASTASAATCEMRLTSSVGMGGGGSSQPPTGIDNESPEERNRPASTTNRHASTRAVSCPSPATSSPFDALPKSVGSGRTGGEDPNGTRDRMDTTDHALCCWSSVDWTLLARMESMDGGSVPRTFPEATTSTCPRGYCGGYTCKRVPVLNQGGMHGDLAGWR